MKMPTFKRKYYIVEEIEKNRVCMCIYTYFYGEFFFYKMSAANINLSTFHRPNKMHLWAESGLHNCRIHFQSPEKEGTHRTRKNKEIIENQ